MLKIFLVGSGGFFGSILRYIANELVLKFFSGQYLFYSTLFVNVFGCFLIGFFITLSETKQMFNTEIRLLIIVGFLGGFTTFSTFGYETFNFIRNGNIINSLSNVFLQIFLGIGAVWLGYSIAKLMTS